jgi:hypothetical protein
VYSGEVQLWAGETLVEIVRFEEEDNRASYDREELEIIRRVKARLLATFQIQRQSTAGQPSDFPEIKPLFQPVEQKTAYAWLDNKAVKAVTDGTYTIYRTDLGTLDIVYVSSGQRVYLASDVDDVRKYVEELENDAFLGGYERELTPEDGDWQQGETYIWQ